MPKRNWTGAAGLIVILAASSGAHAAPITSTAPFTVGDLTFSNFGCTIETNFGSSGPVSCSEITFAPLSPDSITIGGAFSATGNNFTPTSQEDVTITYEVTSTRPISGISMDFNGTAANNAIAGVTESFGTSLAALDNLGQISVLTPVPLSATGTLSTPETIVFVTKDIELDAYLFEQDIQSSATISVINQDFETIPEPASLALLGAAMIGFGLVRRRRRRPATST